MPTRRRPFSQLSHPGVLSPRPSFAVLFLLLLFAVLVPVASIELRVPRIPFGALPTLPYVSLPLLVVLSLFFFCLSPRTLLLVEI